MATEWVKILGAASASNALDEHMTENLWSAVDASTTGSSASALGEAEYRIESLGQGPVTMELKNGATSLYKYTIEQSIDEWREKTAEFYLTPVASGSEGIIKTAESGAYVEYGISAAQGAYTVTFTLSGMFDIISCNAIGYNGTNTNHEPVVSGYFDSVGQLTVILPAVVAAGV